MKKINSTKNRLAVSISMILAAGMIPAAFAEQTGNTAEQAVENHVPGQRQQADHAGRHAPGAEQFVRGQANHDRPQQPRQLERGGDDREAGARAFAPAEYRRGHAATDVLAPGQSALVEFDVIEPAPNIVAFSFEFE